MLCGGEYGHWIGVVKRWSDTLISPLKEYLSSGYEEGIFTETDDVYRKDVLCSQVLLFLFLMQDIREEERRAEIEDYVYNGMVVLLNSREKGKNQ